MEETRDNGGGRRPEAIALAATFLVLAVGTWILGSSEGGWLPGLASRHGQGIDRMLRYLLITTGSLLLGGNILLAWFLVKFSARGKISHRMAAAKTERNWSIALGLLIALVAEGGVLAIGVPVWGEYFAAEAPDDALRIEVTAEQFAWNVRYPGPDGQLGATDPNNMDETDPLGLVADDPMGKDDVVTINSIYVPVGRPVEITLKSKDVLHSFFLPHFRVKQDAVPGMSIPVWFVPTEPGRYELACAELCGLAHYRMKGFINVVSEAELDAWLAENAPDEESEEDEFWG